MDVSKFLERAEAALRKRLPDQAIQMYRQVLVASPGHAAAREGLMTAYKRRAELKGGASIIDKAASRSMYATALGLKGAGKAGAAARSCDAGLERDPENRNLVVLLAECLQAQDLKEEALAVWRAELAAEPNDLQALKAAGQLHYALRQIPEAMDCLERAHVADRHDPEVERLRRHLAAEGTLANTKYESAQSSRDVRRAPSEAPKAGESQASGVEALAARVSENPADSAARRAYALALRGEGRWDEAQATVEEALAAAPTDESLATLRDELRLSRLDARIREAQGRGDEAATEQLKSERAGVEIEDLSRKAAARPGDLALRLRLAKACYKAGQTDKAIEH